MNKAMLSKQINGELIDQLKDDSRALLSFLQNQSDRTVIYALEKLGRLKNGNSREPLLSLLNSPNEIVRVLAI